MTSAFAGPTLLQELAADASLDTDRGPQGTRAEGPAPRRGYDRLTAASLAALTRINAKTQEALARQAALPGSLTPRG